MKLTDEQVISLIDRFILAADNIGWREQRREDHKHWKSWIDPNRLDNISDQDLANYYREYFDRGAGRQTLIKINRDRIIRDVGRFRETLKFLMDESKSVEDRLADVLDKKGKHHIEGMGRGLATSFLMDLDPGSYSTWNAKTEWGLTALGRMPQFAKADTVGDRYTKVLRELAAVRNLRPGVTFIDTDHFMHIVSADPVGIEAVEALRQGGTIATLSGTPPVVPVTDMEFVMEKYLEEFMEANFSKINFGASLELYSEDEESTGRQYPTSIGPIDLLAIDRQKKEFVVIELKKGKTGDAVVGQVLRYMGWVAENMVPKLPGYSVRGIVVVRGEDEKLSYALKQMLSVTAFTYAVSFDLKRV